jgi:uncharacterized membrane protein YhaH (DUF805 family)
MHWFLDPIKDHYFDFEGRETRQAFWMYVLYYLIAYVIVAVIGKVIHVPMLVSLLGLALLLPNLGIGARRLHDTDLSGWWQLLGLIPLVGWVIVIVLFAREGQKKENSYGPVPQAMPQQVSSTHAGAGAGPEAETHNSAPSEPKA